MKVTKPPLPQSNYTNRCYYFISLNIVTKFTEYTGHWMNMTPWKNQTDVINGFDFILKIEGSVIYEQVGIRSLG